MNAKAQAFHFRQKIQKNGEVTLKNLPVVRGQQVELVVLFSPEIERAERLTVRHLLDSELVGLWKNRIDIEDSAIYARQLREKAQQRRQ